MSKVKKRLVEEIKERFGEECADVVDFLYQNGMLDDCRVRAHVVKVEVLQRYTSTDLSVTQIHEDVRDLRDAGTVKPELFAYVLVDLRNAQIR